MMPDDEIEVPADQPDPPYVDDSPPESPTDDPEPAQAGEVTSDGVVETDGNAEVASGTEP